MHKIIINNFEAITSLEMSFDKSFSIVIGEQASGKSTIAKTIYFCKKVRDYLLDYLSQSRNFTLVHPNEYQHAFIMYVRKQFMGCFGTTKHMRPFRIQYFYNYAGKDSKDNRKLTVSLDQKGYAVISFTNNLQREVEAILVEAGKIYNGNLPEGSQEAGLLAGVLNDLRLQQMVMEHFGAQVKAAFASDEEIIYIPAGRSILSSLSDQLPLLNPVSDDGTMDLPLSEFIKLIHRTRNRFGTHMSDIVANYTRTVRGNIKSDDVEIARQTVESILKGDYVSDSDGEKIYYSPKDYVKLKYASSGQQEALWILLLLFLRILEQKKVFIIIEEPEAHLYTSAQLEIMKLIALLVNSTDSKVMLTTHSPYILTSANLLAFSGRVEAAGGRKRQQIVKKRFRIKPGQLQAFMIDNSHGFVLTNIIEHDEGIIDAERIDGVSEFINECMDRLLDLEVADEMPANSKMLS